MLKKRLIGMVIVKDGWAVQSFSYKKYLPLGKPECIVENLDRWGTDEIIVLCIDRSRGGYGPDFKVLERIASMGLETPLIFGGGINNVKDAIKVIQTGADRICVDALLHNDMQTLKKITEFIGVQAMIGCMPLCLHQNHIKWFDYRNNTYSLLSKELMDNKTGVVSELLIIDYENEGKIGRKGANHELITNLPAVSIPIIAFGGITESQQMHTLLSLQIISALAIGNSLNYTEHAIQKLKKNLAQMPLRLPYYEKRHTLINHV